MIEFKYKPKILNIFVLKVYTYTTVVHINMKLINKIN